ncbi:MAG: NAD(P)/FAD-dependent oxidoreductase [Fimbriimonadaceae bacterium]
MKSACFSWLHFYRNYLAREGGEMSAARIPGGSQALCQRIADNLQAEIHFNKSLKSFDTKEDHVELWFEDEMVFSDRAVITVPPPILAQIEWPVDQEFRRNQIAQISMARIIKVALEYKIAWWEQSDWSGRLLTDLPCQQVWIGGREGANILCAYICGEEAQMIAKSPDPAQRVQNAFAEIFPESSEHFLGGKVHAWLDDPYANGAFPFIKPSKFVTAWPGRAEPVGNVHFAGDWTAEWFGFMEGALESAERVNQEINNE